MDAKSIVIGRSYMLREPNRPDADVQQVRVLERVRPGKWRVEWIEPNPGLVDYVKSGSLIAPWNERNALLKDERSHQTLASVAEKEWDGREGPVTEAINLVFESSGDLMYVYRNGILDYQPEQLERLADRAGIAAPSHPYGYCDRHGTCHLPFSAALELAKAFAAAEPSTVLTYVDSWEQKYEVEAMQPGHSYLVESMTRYRPRWALARQWAGADAAIAQREAEIKRLRDLIYKTIWDLRRPETKPERVANRLERALHGR